MQAGFNLARKIRHVVGKYQNKTFGVISLQGHDQARIIENLVESN